MSVSSWWDGYTSQELHRLLYLHQVDPIGIVWIGAVLLALLLVVGPPRAVTSQFAVAATSSILMTAVLAASSALPLYFNVFKLPITEKKIDLQSWTAMAYGGRFVYLTRWLITLQLLYFVTSVYAEANGGWVRAAIYALATPMAAMATFVSVQFYGMVAATENYQKVVEVWGPRGIDVARIGNVVHAPAMLLGLVDIFVAKDQTLLKAVRPPIATLLLAVSCFAGTYIASMVINRHLTGVWPYSLMNKIDTVNKFAMFCVGQVAVLNLFLALIWMLQTIVEATYSRGGL